MADKITVSSKNTYGSRISNSFAKIGFGFIFVILSIILIFVNEKSFLHRKVGLNEGKEIVKEAIASEINPELDQAEIHVYGETSSPAQALKDPVFGVTTDDLKMQRNVEMYQRVERSEEKCTDNIGGSETCDTTYYYDKMWTPHYEDSSNFYETEGHENPTTWKYEAQERDKNPIMLGVYTLEDVFVERLTDYNLLNLSEQEIIIPEEYKTTTTVETSDNTVEENNNSYLYGETTGENEGVNNGENNNSKFHITSNYIYIGNDEGKPQIGDLKITFSSVKTGKFSVIGQQNGDTLTNFITPNGESIALLNKGNVTAENMFLNAQKANKTKTRIFRCLLLVLMYIGFSMILDFISTLAKFLPFLSNIIGVGTGIISFALTLVFGFLAIGISRVAVRPIVGIICLVVVVAGIILLIKARKNKKGNITNKPDNNNDKNIEIIEA